MLHFSEKETEFHTKQKASWQEKRTKIIEGLNKVYEKLLEFKRSKNSELVVLREGKIVRIKP